MATAPMITTIPQMDKASLRQRLQNYLGAELLVAKLERDLLCLQNDIGRCEKETANANGLKVLTGRIAVTKGRSMIRGLEQEQKSANESADCAWDSLCEVVERIAGDQGFPLEDTIFESETQTISWAKRLLSGSPVTER